MHVTNTAPHVSSYIFVPHLCSVPATCSGYYLPICLIRALGYDLCSRPGLVVSPHLDVARVRSTRRSYSLVAHHGPKVLWDELIQ